jgi:uncharacterized protein (TIGR02284 family)
MPGILRPDHEVALQDVTRLTERSIRLLEDLGALAEDTALGDRLRERAARRAALRQRIEHAASAAGEAPADEDPERAHLQALWYKLKAAIGTADEASVLREALAAQDAELRSAIDRALEYAQPPELTAGLQSLAADVRDVDDA